MEDMDKVIADNIGLVYKQLHRFNRAYDEDAYSYALEGLWIAAKTFDGSKDIAFSTYASTCIYNRIAYYLREHARKSKLQVTSLEETLYDDFTVADVISGGVEPHEEYMKSERMSVLWTTFDKLVDDMGNGTARTIIELWRDSDFKLTQKDIAKAIGTSQANVSRTLSAFKHKLKKEMEDYL